MFEITFDSTEETIDADFDSTTQAPGGGGTYNYNDLTNKPQIAGVTLQGNKSLADLGIAAASDIPSVPVQSVNGKTGAVVLGASDVGALPNDTTIPTKTSQLQNDSEFITSADVPAAATSVPANLGTAAVGSSGDFARADHVHNKPTPADLGALPTGGGTMTGAIAMGGYKVTGLGTPVNDGDASTKKYVDDAIAGIGTVFTIKGDVAAVADLPATGNAVGDVYYVQAVSAAYVWLETTAHPTGYWEEFGEPIDLSGYIEKPTSATANQILTFNGTSWVAENKPSYTKSEIGLGNVDNVQQYSADNPPPYPVTSVNNQTGAVSLSIPSTASDVGAVAVAQGVGHAGEFCVVGSDGNITTMTLSTWQGGSF